MNGPEHSQAIHGSTNGLGPRLAPNTPELYLGRNEGFTNALISHAIHPDTDLLGSTCPVDTLEAGEASSCSSQGEHWPGH